VNVLPLLPSAFNATGCTITGVNSSGQVVGYYSNTAAYNLPFEYSIGSGTAKTLNMPSGALLGGPSTWNISENGNVAGDYTVGISSTANAFLTNANTNATSEVGGSLTVTTVYSTNNNGFVAAKAVNSYSTSDGNVWNGSAWVDLGPSPSGSGYTKGSSAIGLDSNGDVVGFYGMGSATKGDPFYAQYNGSGGWNGMLDLGNLNSFYSGYSAGQANAINDNGQVVGWDFNGTKSASTEYAFIAGTTAGSAAPLSNYVPNLGDFSRLSQALAIDDAGCIVGIGISTISGSGNTDVFLLTPVATPEPSTLLLAISGLIGLLAYAWRKRG
jgi:hypothetical protein